MKGFVANQSPKIKGENKRINTNKLIDLENSINARCRPEKSLIMFQRFKDRILNDIQIFRDKNRLKQKYRLGIQMDLLYKF